MNYDNPVLVAELVENLKTTDRLHRAPNRALIDALYNGYPPWSEAEARENHVDVNINFKEGTNLLLQAREQFENAFLTTANFFSVRVPLAPESKKQDYGAIITKEINAVMKSPKWRDSRAYLHTFRSKIGSLVLHGPGPQMWEDQWKWLPYFVPVEDLLIPTSTEITFENLNRFAAGRWITPGDLYRKTIGMGENMDPGWVIEVVRGILDEYKEVTQNPNHFNWAQHPEQMQELIKQNGLNYDMDSIPKIRMWDFYYQKDDEPKCWYRNTILDKDCVPARNTTGSPVKFIYSRPDRPFGETLDQILHVQCGDGNNKPPFLYHSMRSLGWILYDVCHLMNRTRCQFAQKVFEDMMNLFRVQDPSDRGRLDQVYMGMRYGIVPEGLSFVKGEERCKPDANLVEMQLSNLKQLMSEPTSSYTQEIDSGTSKERTKYEVQAILAQTAKLTGSMLNLAYLQEAHAYQEIARRLTLKNSPDFTTKKFQNRLRDQKIPEKWIDSERWDIEVERVMGAGNAQLELAQARGIYEIKDTLNPEAQQVATHDYIFALTHDPKKANVLAPLDGAPHVSNTVHDTELAFGTLMQGIPVSIKPGLNPIEVVGTMIRLMAGVVQQIMQTDGVGRPDQVMGLFNASQYAGGFIQILARDPNQKPLVKKFGDALGRIMNEVKAFAQRQQEMMQQQNGHAQMDPEKLMKLEVDRASASQKLQSKEQSHRQKLAHKQQDFSADQARKNAETLSEIQRLTMLATVEASNKEQEAKESEE